MTVNHESGPLGRRCRLIAAWLFLASPAHAKAHSTDPWDWIIQHVCADSSDRPVPADPYDGCPSGTHESRLKLGDPMPYLKHDQPGPNHPKAFSDTIPIPWLIAISAGRIR